MIAGGWLMLTIAAVTSGGVEAGVPNGAARPRGIATARDAIAPLDDPTVSDRAGPVPIGNPGVWFGAAAYPPAAMRAGAQGRVIARIGVDPSGHPTNCAVTESSGSADLDAATCRIAGQRMTFTPAHDAAGKPVAGNYRLAVRWQLPAGNVAAPMATTLVSIGADGTILSCTSTVPTPLGDLCGAFPVGRKLDVPASMRGKVFAIGTMVRPLAE